MPDAAEPSYDSVRDLIHALIEHDPGTKLRIEVEGELRRVLRIENRSKDGWAVVLMPEGK